MLVWLEESKSGGSGGNDFIGPIIFAIFLLLFFGKEMFFSIINVLTNNTSDIGIFSGLFAILSGFIMLPIAFFILMFILEKILNIKKSRTRNYYGGRYPGRAFDQDLMDDIPKIGGLIFTMYMLRCIYVIFT